MFLITLFIPVTLANCKALLTHKEKGILKIVLLMIKCNNFGSLLVLTLSVFFCLFLVGCTKHPDAEQLQALEEYKAAALAAEEMLEEKRRELATLEDELHRKMKELQSVIIEQEKMISRLAVGVPEFPWPPPKASATVVIPSDFMKKPSAKITRLGDVETILRYSLDECGYVEKGFYAVPKGFAMVTRLEQINEDGTPKEAQHRWAISPQPLRSFSLNEYLKALFLAKRGLYRIIVFIVTDIPFSQADSTVSRRQAMDWLAEGFNRLPKSISELEYSNDYICTAFVYEFEKIQTEKEARLKLPGRLTGRTHLKKSNLWEKLLR